MNRIAVEFHRGHPGLFQRVPKRIKSISYPGVDPGKEAACRYPKANGTKVCGWQLTFTGEDSPMATLLLSVMGAFAEFEREMIRERTNAGLAVARSEGRVGGRKPKLNPQQQAELVRGVQEERYSMASAARLFQVDPATVSRLMAR